MKKLTFEGFLGSYLKQLSLSGSGRLSVLAREAADTNPRLKEPLLLYTFFTGSSASLLRAVGDSAVGAEYQSLFSEKDTAELREAFERGECRLPAEYLKVWRSYVYQRDRSLNDDHSKELMRRKVLKLQSEKKLSNYRLYTDLQLNPGNINTWLKHGDNAKVSLEVARAVVQYAEHPRA